MCVSPGRGSILLGIGICPEPLPGDWNTENTITIIEQQEIELDGQSKLTATINLQFIYCTQIL